MVFFTCSSCGESLKKNAVEKHFNSRCSSAPARYVTCMDCSKDFWGDEYITHTSCITEDEKYGNSKQIVKELKGKKKQEEWIKNLRDYLENCKKIDPALQSIIKQILNFDNIPQKEKKFKNFLTNSVKVKSTLADKAWEIFQGALKGTSTGATSTSISINNAEKTTVMQISDSKVINNLETEKSKKKKNKKRQIEEMEVDEIQDNLSQESPSKKRKLMNENCEEKDMSAKGKKKNKLDIVNDSEDVMEVTEVNPIISKKKKIKKSLNIEVIEPKESSVIAHNNIKNSNKENHNSKKKLDLKAMNNGDLLNKKKLLSEGDSNDCVEPFKFEKVVKKILKETSEGMKIKKLEKLIVPQLLLTKEVLSEIEAKRLFREHINSNKYVIIGKIIKFKKN